MYEFLSHLSFSRIKVTFEALEPTELYEYMGSAYRGCFGQSLREQVCRQKRGNCQDCRQKFTCVFSRLFNSFTPVDHPWHRKYPRAPHPYTISPLHTSTMLLNKGDCFGFELSLIGQSSEHFPALWNVFRQMGETGIGKGRKKFRFAGLQALNPNEEYQPLSFFDKPAVLSLDNLAQPKPGKSIKLTLETPLRLKDKGMLVTKAPPFALFAKRLALRLGLLAHFYGDAPWPGEIFELKGETPQLGESEVIMVDWQRYSGTQDTTMKFDGLTGTIIYTGNFDQETINLLFWGSWLHAGATATFGLGRYSLNR